MKSSLGWVPWSRVGVTVAAQVAVLLFAVGCASVSTHSKERKSVSSDAPAPKVIYVQPFEAPADVFRVDRPEKEAKELRDEESARLARGIVSRIRKRILPAIVVTPGAAKPGEPAWLVTGRFVRVNQGSRALRMIVGFGAGGSKVETEVEVYDLSGSKPKLIFTFSTTGGSNAQPGAIANLNWWSAAIGGSALALSGITFDINRTAREITASMSRELALRGMLPPEQRALRPKELGKWP